MAAHVHEKTEAQRKRHRNKPSRKARLDRRRKEREDIFDAAMTARDTAITLEIDAKSKITANAPPDDVSAAVVKARDAEHAAVAAESKAAELRKRLDSYQINPGCVATWSLL
jgi:hypothetical protein